jgi:putative transposase
MHIIQRGNNRARCFYTDADYLVYLAMLGQRAEETNCAVHAYVLMTNHVHLLVSPCNEGSASALMQKLGQSYVQYVNRRHRRTGTLWEGRFRSCLVGDARYFLTCQRYIELNPVRAGIVAIPASYAWSSYRANALGHDCELITPHTAYNSLGDEAPARASAYRALFDSELPVTLVNEIRRASNGNLALGNERFLDATAKALGRDVRAGRPGRPRKAQESDAKSCSDPDF